MEPVGSQLKRSSSGRVHPTLCTIFVVWTGEQVYTSSQTKHNFFTFGEPAFQLILIRPHHCCCMLSCSLIPKSHHAHKERVWGHWHWFLIQQAQQSCDYLHTELYWSTCNHVMVHRIMLQCPQILSLFRVGSRLSCIGGASLLNTLYFMGNCFL